MSFDINKCKKDERGHLMAQTRDGRKVRILCTDSEYKDLGQRQPICGEIEGGDAWHWCMNGRFMVSADEQVSDLVNIPEKRVVWANVYPDVTVVGGYRSKKEADAIAMNGRIACVKVEFTEGEGL